MAAIRGADCRDKNGAVLSRWGRFFSSIGLADFSLLNNLARFTSIFRGNDDTAVYNSLIISFKAKACVPCLQCEVLLLCLWEQFHRFRDGEVIARTDAVASSKIRMAVSDADRMCR